MAHAVENIAEHMHQVHMLNIRDEDFADDIVLLAENEEDLQALLDAICMESKKVGLQINTKKNQNYEQHTNIQ